MQSSGIASVKRKYTCSECAKTFRNVDDMHLHVEACLLDAFEMEAHALIMNQGYCGSDSPLAGSKRQINDYSGGYQAIFRPYVEKRNVKRAYRDEVAYSAPAPRSRTVVIGDPLEEDEDELDYEETESETPPQLELAEPHQKKYRRVFPIGEDGKQIRPKMECPTCGLVLYRHNFSTHYRIHTGELPFTCSFCDKRFRTSSALTVHTRCHTGDKPYTCPHCDYCCITKRNLDRHIINNHVKRRRVIQVRGGVVTYGRTRGRPPTYVSSGTAYGPSFGPMTTRSRKIVVDEHLDDEMHFDAGVDEEDKEEEDSDE